MAHTMDESEVNRLLLGQQHAHSAYRHAANPAPGEGAPNYPLAEQHVANALDLLEQAHAADSDHLASGWSYTEEKVPYATLAAFYRKYATIP